jgi:hypothetical protein
MNGWVKKNWHKVQSIRAQQIKEGRKKSGIILTTLESIGHTFCLSVHSSCIFICVILHIIGKESLWGQLTTGIFVGFWYTMRHLIERGLVGLVSQVKSSTSFLINIQTCWSVKYALKTQLCCSHDPIVTVIKGCLVSFMYQSCRDFRVNDF